MAHELERSSGPFLLSPLYSEDCKISKVTLNRLGAGYRSTNALNNDLEVLEEAFEKTLSRDGTSPNQMEAEFDMNGFRILNLPEPVEATDPVRLSDVQGGLGLGLLLYSDPGAGSVPTSFNSLISTDHINVRAYDVQGDDTDETAKIQMAVNAALASGRNLYFPPGLYRSGTIEISQEVPLGFFSPGIKIFGSGCISTMFNSTAANGALFNVTSATLLKFLLGVEFSSFGIQSANGAALSTGIRLRSALNVRMSQIWIKGLSGDGVNITCESGDADASNMVYMEHMRIENCAQWGINATSDEGSNEISFVTGYNVFIQNCGTIDAAYPPTTGNFRAKNQILTLRSCGFTLGNNVGVFLAGGAGAPNSATIDQCAIENNGKYALLIMAGEGIKVVNTQFYSEDVQNPETATHGVLIDGTDNVITNVEIDNPIVRVAGNVGPFTAFKIQGINAKRDTIRVRNVSWLNYDYPTQTRFDNVQFDSIPENCGIAVASATEVRLRADPFIGGGNTTPHRLRNGLGGTSTSGEFVPLCVEGFSGLGISNSGLAANTLYNVYLYDNGGLPGLELSTTAPDNNPIQNYLYKTGDVTKIFKGRVATNGASQFVTVGAEYTNPLRFGGTTSGQPGSLWPNGLDGKLYYKFGVTLPANGSAGDLAYVPTFESAVSFDPPSVAANSIGTADVSVTCAADAKCTGVGRVGGWGGLVVTGSVKAANTVTLALINPTAAPIDLASATIYVDIQKR